MPRLYGSATYSTVSLGCESTAGSRLNCNLWDLYGGWVGGVHARADSFESYIRAAETRLCAGALLDFSGNWHYEMHLGSCYAMRSASLK